MRNALTSRDNVDVVGVPGKTLLLACDGFEIPLAADGDCNERQITAGRPLRLPGGRRRVDPGQELPAAASPSPPPR